MYVWSFACFPGARFSFLEPDQAFPSPDPGAPWSSQELPGAPKSSSENFLELPGLLSIFKIFDLLDVSGLLPISLLRPKIKHFLLMI